MSTNSKLDPLYIIFEQHLYNFNDDTDTEAAFVEKVVQDYLRFLETTGSIVAPKLKNMIAEELKDQVENMLKKKLYGFSSMEDFICEQQKPKKRARSARKKD